jgi:hypothetical protein|tara:strand:+ start:57 stop:635 length:579 start_codon:yes stop_codon:yes gene_type:complete
MKTCKDCNQNQPYSSFHIAGSCSDGYSVRCKSCHSKKFYKPTPNKLQCRECGKPSNKQNSHKTGLYRKDGSHIYESICKLCKKIYTRERQKIRRLEDLSYRLHQNLRARINQKVLSKGGKTSLEFLGCSIDEYKIYLEERFDQHMNWDNYGKDGYWEIDHIHPVSKGGSFHYTNTQPLPIIENREKGDKILC